jgi:hypothetical protein
VAAEGINVKPSTDPSAVPIAVDIGSDGFQYQLTQPAFGPDAGAKTMVDDVDAKRLPVGGAAIGQPGNAAATDTTSAWSLIALLKRLGNLQGDVVEAAPATDTASSGLNGRLQRVAQRLTTIFGSLGDTADALVAAGAVGTMQAKLRRITQGLEDLKTLIVLAAGSAVIGRVMRAETTGTASVAIGASISAALDCRGYTPVGIIVPSTFDGNQLRFQVSGDGTNFFDLYDTGNNVVVMTVAASRAYPLYGELDGWNYIKILTYSSGSANNQATTTTDFLVQLKS